jgi:hypothetical protein
VNKQLVYVEDLISEFRSKRDNMFTKQDVITIINSVAAKHGTDRFSLLFSNNDSWDDECYD